MELTRFIELSKIYSKLPLSKNVWDTPEYKEYMDALDNDSDCREWDLKRKITEAGINYKKYCCIYMAYYLIEDKKPKNLDEINYDSIITETRKKYGIPIHDGGSSYIRINFCPWCGRELNNK